MKFVKLAMIVVTALGSVGCQTAARGEFGASPLTVSSGLQDAFNEYLQSAIQPQYFMVAEDGRAYGYSYCDASKCYGNDFDYARDACLRVSAGVPCKIYALGGRVVWDESALQPMASGAPSSIHVPDGIRKPRARSAAGHIVERR
jgi:hypothetical protein